MPPYTSTVERLPFLTKRATCYSAIPYALALMGSGSLVWLGVQLSWVLNRSTEIKVLGFILAAAGVLLALCCILVFWILLTEVTGFQTSDSGSIRLERSWLPAIATRSAEVLIRLGCVYRVAAPGEGCVRYVVVKAGGAFMPMALELYESLRRRSSS